MSAGGRSPGNSGVLPESPCHVRQASRTWHKPGIPRGRLPTPAAERCRACALLPRVVSLGLPEPFHLRNFPPPLCSCSQLIYEKGFSCPSLLYPTLFALGTGVQSLPSKCAGQAGGRASGGQHDHVSLVTWGTCPQGTSRHFPISPWCQPLYI